MKSAKTIAYLGPEGSYSHCATEFFASQLSGSPAYLPLKTIRQVLEYADQTPDTVAVLPIENSVEGTVRETIDNLIRTKNLQILRQTIMPIKHCLISQSTDIHTVISHPQALSQCQNFIHEKKLNTIEASSTAAAAQNLQPGHAAIANEKTAKLYGLNILHENINDYPDNCTRFALIGGWDTPKGASTLLAFSTKNEPGALLKILQIFYDYNVNLSHISSRPSKTSLGEYTFFAEFDGYDQKILDEIKQHTQFFRLLGSYDIIPYRGK